MTTGAASSARSLCERRVPGVCRKGWQERGAAHTGREEMKARATHSLSLHAGSRAGGPGVSPSWRASFFSLLPPSDGTSAVTGRRSAAQGRSGQLHQQVKGQRSLPARALCFHAYALLPVRLNMCLQQVSMCEGNAKKVSPGQGLKHSLP